MWYIVYIVCWCFYIYIKVYVMQLYLINLHCLMWTVPKK